MSRLRWPRGKFNGRRIVGFAVSIGVRVNCWRFFAAWNLGEPVLGIGPIRIKGEATYAPSESHP